MTDQQCLEHVLLRVQNEQAKENDKRRCALDAAANQQHFKSCWSFSLMLTASTLSICDGGNPLHMCQNVFVTHKSIRAKSSDFLDH